VPQQAEEGGVGRRQQGKGQTLTGSGWS
jgi:hypothetical protein